MSDTEPLVDELPLAKRARFAVSPSVTTGGADADAMTERTAEAPYNDFDSNDGEREEDEVAENVIMSVLIQHGRVGCAVFHAASRILYLLEDAAIEAHTSTFRAETVIMRGDAAAGAPVDGTDAEAESSNAAEQDEPTRRKSEMRDLVGLIVDQHHPDLILASSKCPSDDLEAMKNDLEQNGGMLQVRPAREFDSTAGMMRLLALFESNDDDADSDGDPFVGVEDKQAHGGTISSATEGGAQHTFANRLKLSAAVDAERMKLTTAAAGALLSHLARTAAHGALPNAGEPGLSRVVSRVEVMALAQLLHVTTATQRALAIFVEEGVASAQSNNSKEGLSLFNILDFTVSPMGRALLRRWLAWPSAVLETINARHDAVDCLLRPQLAADLGLLGQELRGCANISSLLGAAFARGSPGPAAWRKLLEYCKRAVAVNEILASFDSPPQMLGNILRAIDVKTLLDIVDMLGIIDWEESALERTVVISHGYDSQLDEWRRSYAALPSLLSSVAESLRGAAMQQHADSFNICFFPQLGYLIALPRKDDEADGAERDIDGLTFSFSSNLMDYFKSKEMEDLDVHLGDLHSLVADRQIEIVNGLQQRVLAKQSLIMNAAQAMAELDCLMSLARAAQDYGYVRPTMVDENVIEIHAARHPLSERCVESFVPNDAYIVGGKGVKAEPSQGTSMTVVTGANCCGKSVYIKSIAMACYMAQCGSFVPAERAVLGVCDKILTSIQVLESMGKMQSNFMIDMSQCSYALRACTPRSLVLLDETAKGTDSKDGAALFAAIVWELLSRGADCPKVAIATHFYEVFFNGVLPADLAFTPMHMQVMLENVEDKEDIIYLFKAAHGFTDTSNAGHCARLFGIDADIVNRGDYVTRLLRQGQASSLAFEGLEDDDEEEEHHAFPTACRTSKTELLAVEQIARLFLEWDIQHTIEEQQDANEERRPATLVRDKLRELLTSGQADEEDAVEHMEQ